MALEASNDQKLAAIQETGKKAAENLKKQAVDFDNDTTEGKGDIPTDLTKLIEISKPGSTTENIEDEEKQLIRQAIDQAIKDTTNEYAAKIPGLTEMHVRAWIFNETIKNDLEKLPAEIALERYYDGEGQAIVVNQVLCNLGFLTPDKVTDSYGPETETAVAKLQEQLNQLFTSNQIKVEDIKESDVKQWIETYKTLTGNKSQEGGTDGKFGRRTKAALMLALKYFSELQEPEAPEPAPTPEAPKITEPEAQGEALERFPEGAQYRVIVQNDPKIWYPEPGDFLAQDTPIYYRMKGDTLQIYIKGRTDGWETSRIQDWYEKPGLFQNKKKKEIARLNPVDRERWNVMNRLVAQLKQTLKDNKEPIAENMQHLLALNYGYAQNTVEDLQTVQNLGEVNTANLAGAPEKVTGDPFKLPEEEPQKAKINPGAPNGPLAKATDTTTTPTDAAAEEASETSPANLDPQNTGLQILETNRKAIKFAPSNTLHIVTKDPVEGAEPLVDIQNYTIKLDPEATIKMAAYQRDKQTLTIGLEKGETERQIAYTFENKDKKTILKGPDGQEIKAEKKTPEKPKVVRKAPAAPPAPAAPTPEPAAPPAPAAPAPAAPAPAAPTEEEEEEEEEEAAAPAAPAATEPKPATDTAEKTPQQEAQEEMLKSLQELKTTSPTILANDNEHKFRFCPQGATACANASFKLEEKKFTVTVGENTYEATPPVGKFEKIDLSNLDIDNQSGNVTITGKIEIPLVGEETKDIPVSIEKLLSTLDKMANGDNDISINPPGTLPKVEFKKQN